MNYLYLALIVASITGLYFLFKKIKLTNKKYFGKIISVLIAVIFFIFYFLSGANLLAGEGTISLIENSPFDSAADTFFVALTCHLFIAVHVFVIMYSFFDYKIFKNLFNIFSIVFCVLVLFTLDKFLYSYECSFNDITGEAYYLKSYLWIKWLMLIEIGYIFFLTVYSNIKFRINIKKADIKGIIIGILMVLLFSIPPYVPLTVVGNIGFSLTKGFTLYHRLYLYLGFFLMFFIYFLLREKDGEFSRMVLLYISLTTLISYVQNDSFSIFIHPTSWPLHLCNTAMFIVPLCLIFKTEKLFYFTFFINVIGALLAMFMPSYGAEKTATSYRCVSFYINHIMAFMMPVLCVFCNVYQRPKLRQFIYSMAAFLVYFITMLIFNAWFTNYDPDVDFFFLNSDYIVTKVGKWAEDTRLITIEFNIKDLNFKFYPLYQTLFFLVYVILGLAEWFLYSLLFSIEDFYKNVRTKEREIDYYQDLLFKKYNTKKLGDCMNQESVGKLLIKDFGKKYGKNTYFAVDNINISVKEGEVIGFLGPNGAGKSTTIKCIVGIQPPTKGELEVNGYNIVSEPMQTKMQLGYVPDHYALYENLTGREYLNYIADLFEVSKEEREERLNTLLNSLHMEQSIDKQIHTYSHGMKQKIAVIASIIHNPKLWILDEPLTGLDPVSIFEVKECMKNHAKNGNIVFFSSHLIDVVEKLCTRIIIINDHHVVSDVNLEDLKNKKIDLEKYYLECIGEKELAK